jgi:hypothetical protein
MLRKKTESRQNDNRRICSEGKLFGKEILRARVIPEKK